MPELFKLIPPGDALSLLLERMEHIRMPIEILPTAKALGRFTGRSYVADSGLPTFARSSMDGYSVRAADTFGATEGIPAYLDVSGEISMGHASNVKLETGEAAVAYTGGMLAEGADAVVMVEHTQLVGNKTIEVTKPVAPGENVLQINEDVQPGQEVVPRGHKLRPQDIGALLALGLIDLEIVRQPRIGIVSTGDEVIPPDKTPQPGQIRDINTYTISALVDQAGGIPIHIGIFPDDLDAQRNAATIAIEKSDIVIFSAGSSVGSRDMTARVLSELGNPGVLVHGISIKPGKPCIAGVARNTPIFGLPGNPVSAMVVFDLMVRPTIRSLLGASSYSSKPSINAVLTRDVPSVSGRQDFFPVSLTEGPEQINAEPIFGKSNLIFTLVRADGLASVSLNSGGLYAGETVQVILF